MTLGPRWRNIVAAVACIALSLGGYAHFEAGAAPTGSSVDRQEARAFAKAVNLRVADVPRLIPLPPDPATPGHRRVEREVDRCSGVEDDPVLSARSPEFNAGVPGRVKEIWSQVEVSRTEGEPVLDAAANFSSRGLECYREGLRRSLELELGGRSGHALGGLSVTRMAKVPGNVPRSFGLRVRIGLLVEEETPFTATIDVLGFLQGPAVVTLTLSGAPEPIPAATAGRLLERLEARASTALSSLE
jgi:hypothetical protein